MIPNNITKEHIEKAIEEIDKNGTRKGRQSSTYDLVYSGKYYPPKLVISIANRFANGSELDSNDFYGGKGTPAFELLKKEGFEIIAKNDPITTLIENYKRRIAETQLKDEIYKWELVNQFRGRPNPEATDFYQEIKGVKFKNLIYAMSMAVIHHLAKDKPEELRQLFIHLYDETKDLTERVKSFNKDTLKIYRELGETLQHHQDERSIATYLTFHNSDKYTFYKSSFYKKYCKLLGIKEAKKNEKYTHYLTLVDELIEKHIAPDTELIEQVKALIPEFYNGTNHKLLAQDILFQMLDKKEETSYWIFQGNPKVFDFETALRDNVLSAWTVSAHKAKIKVGDKVILWITGNQSGCYALAEVTSEPHPRTPAADDDLWKEEDKSELKAGLKITHNLVDMPILKESLEGIQELEDFKAGNEGTNFSATEEEFNAILHMSKSTNTNYWIYAPGRNAEHWEEFYTKNIMAIGWDAIGDLNQYKTKDEIVGALRRVNGGEGSKKNNATANFEFANTIQIGDVVIVKHGRSNLLGYGVITSDYFYDDKRENYTSCRTINWKRKGNWEVNHSLVLKTLTDITKYDSEIVGYNKYYDYLLAIINGDEQINTRLKMDVKATNQIFYGPPGTGKTFYLKDQLFDTYTSKQTSITKAQHFETVVSGCSWWQVIAIALLDLGSSKVSDIYNHDWVQKKASLSNSKTIRPTLWGQLQSHTIDECEYVKVANKQTPLIFYKTKSSYWEILEEQVEELVPELYDLKDSVDNYNPDPDKLIKHYDFVTFHQSFAYEDFIEGIKPILPENGEVSKDLGYTIEDGVFKNLCTRAKNDPDNRYAIFIDEINRGNVSAIFGELITLIENDKRKGTKNELSIKLPYSKNEFSVPSNLDIYGTMNTADRSVEALDTALRRRFEFKEMMPDLKVIEEEFVEGIELSEVLDIINNRIELLIDRDHTIGHSYFLNVDTEEKLANAFNNKIVPLLQEYFYGDYGKIGLVLGKGFVEKIKNDTVEFASFDYDNANDFKTSTYILKHVETNSIIDAVTLLLGIKETTLS
jgi:hypothetical protein